MTDFLDPPILTHVNGKIRLLTVINGENVHRFLAETVMAITRFKPHVTITPGANRSLP